MEGTDSEREFFTVHEPMLQKVCSYESDLGTGRGKELGDPAEISNIEAKKAFRIKNN